MAKQRQWYLVESIILFLIERQLCRKAEIKDVSQRCKTFDQFESEKYLVNHRGTVQLQQPDFPD